MNVPAICRLKIERFRCVKDLTWHPTKGVNVILGGGDVGKTTILDAIALLLSPTNPANLSDTDYHAREVAAGFVIEAIVSMPAQSGINHQTKPAWPWEWDGSDIKVPGIAGEAASGEPVYRLRVRGTEDLELLYEIVQPDGSADSLSVALRRSIGLVRLSGDNRNDGISASCRALPWTVCCRIRPCVRVWRPSWQKAMSPSSWGRKEKPH
jgi:putative ATP-dependent endonuclease of OLD family